jgi:CRP-like cAMP-binding protein
LHSVSEGIFNRILLALPHAVREDVLQRCDRIELASGHLIYGSGAEVEYAYFIDTGLVSIIKRMEDGRSVEIAAIGAEGLLGLFAAHGFDHALLDHIAQMPVLALRIPRRALQNAISKHETLHGAVTRYLVLAAELLAQVSACNRLHPLEQRCCQWLLVARDNALSDQIQITQEFLASLLGAQRPSVSTATNRLRKRGLIRYAHGRISILNRAALEEAACECYRSRCNLINQAFGASKTSV